MNYGHDTVGLASIVGLASAAIPDEVVSFTVKVITGVAVALVTAFVHAAGKWLFKRLLERRRNEPTLKG